jgi:butanol dehydrogenase
MECKMMNFWANLSTEVFFGEGQVKVLGKQIKKHGSKVLLAYGGGSIKRNGVYDAVVKELNSAEIPFVELADIKPNPRISSVRKGAEICREQGVDFILAVGAGSVIDCCKGIAAARYYSGDPWDFFEKGTTIKKALPIGTVLTLAATGSEMNAGTVVTNEETNQKLSTGSMKLKPRFSIMDPKYTFSVPPRHTAAGIADIVSHVFEQYFSNPGDTFMQDRMSEAVIKTCLRYGPIVMKEPENYEARANIMWAGTIALNGLLGMGKEGEWSTHMIEHEVSAIYDLTHGVGLAIIHPNWMREVLDDKTAPMFAKYGREIFGIEGDSDMDVAKKAIDKTSEFFTTLGLPSKLSEEGIGTENFELMAEKALKQTRIGRLKPLTKESVISILNASA